MWRGHATWWFSLGEVVGGLVTGALLALLGAVVVGVVPAVPAVTIWAVLALVLVAHEIGLVRVPLPQNARQVPPEVVDDGGLVGAVRFGFEMGTGLRTYMTSALPHVVALAVLLVGGFPAGVLAGLGFGVGRALMPLGRMAMPEGTWDAALDRRDRVVRAVLWVATLSLLAALARP